MHSLIRGTKQRPPFTALAWRHSIVLASASVGVVLLSFLLGGQQGASASLAGFVTGAFATASAGVSGTATGGAGLLAALLLLALSPEMPVFLLLCLLLCAVAGIEVNRSGTRISIMVLLGITLLAPVMMQQGLSALPFAGVGLAAGFLVIRYLMLSGIIGAQPVSPHHSVQLGLFLASGIVLSQSFVMVLGGPYSHWIAVLFISRALVPFPYRKEPLKRYGTGAALGVLATIAIEALHPSDVARIMLAIGALVLGVRFLIHPKPIAPAMMTIAVLLSTAPTMAAALFRAEAVALVLGIIVFVGVVLDRIWQFVLGPEGEPHIQEQLPRG